MLDQTKFAGLTWRTLPRDEFAIADDRVDFPDEAFKFLPRLETVASLSACLTALYYVR